MSAPKDNLVRAWARPEAMSLRAKDGEAAGNTLYGHFAVFNEWTEINSWMEGQFLERIAPTAFDDTFVTRKDQIRVLYDHGADPSIGNKPLGQITDLRSDTTGAYYEVDLFDASYVNDLKPAIRSGQLGASFRFRVTAEEWVDPTEATSDNPGKLPQRTITGAELYEFGPVTFPAYDSATAGLRSRTDDFANHLVNDPLFVRRFVERVGPAVVSKILAEIPPTAELGEDPPLEPPTVDEGNDDESPTENADDHAEDAPVTADGGEGEPTPRSTRFEWWSKRSAPFEAHLSRLEKI
jgi:HK97 family phage prohead protease